MYVLAILAGLSVSARATEPCRPGGPLRATVAALVGYTVPRDYPVVGPSGVAFVATADVEWRALTAGLSGGVNAYELLGGRFGVVGTTGRMRVAGGVKYVFQDPANPGHRVVGWLEIGIRGRFRESPTTISVSQSAEFRTLPDRTLATVMPLRVEADALWHGFGGRMALTNTSSAPLRHTLTLGPSFTLVDTNIGGCLE